MLLAATLISIAFGELIQGIAIAVVLAINTALGFFTELKAIRSVEALREIWQVKTTVRREGQETEMPAEELVPGDIVVLDAGDVVTADMRLLEASKLQVDESALTGESVPVGKSVESSESEVPLAERSNMVFKGTSVTRGNGEGVVVSIGMETELGKIGALVEEWRSRRPRWSIGWNLLGKNVCCHTSCCCRCHRIRDNLRKRGASYGGNGTSVSHRDSARGVTCGCYDCFSPRCVANGAAKCVD